MLKYSGTASTRGQLDISESPAKTDRLTLGEGNLSEQSVDKHFEVDWGLSGFCFDAPERLHWPQVCLLRDQHLVCKLCKPSAHPCAMLRLLTVHTTEQETKKGHGWGAMNRNTMNVTVERRAMQPHAHARADTRKIPQEPLGEPQPLRTKMGTRCS